MANLRDTMAQEPSSGLTIAEKAALDAAKKQKEKAPATKDKPVVYQKDVPVDEPTSKFAAGGSVGSASKRADGCASKGKTKGKFV